MDDFNERLMANAATASTQIVPNLVNPFVSFERYELIRNADGTVSFKALKNSKYVQSDWGTGPLEAQRNAIGSWEKFVKVPQP